MTKTPFFFYETADYVISTPDPNGYCLRYFAVWGMLNNAQNANATAGGAGSGAVQNGTATGQGTGIANVGFGTVIELV